MSRPVTSLVLWKSDMQQVRLDIQLSWKGVSLLAAATSVNLQNTMASEPSGHKLSALEERYATGIAVQTQ